MNKNLKYGVVIFVLICAVGFASITTNLLMNGAATLGFNSSDFDVYFSSASAETGGTATIDNLTRRNITYSTKTLSNVGDQAVLDYTVVNNSTQYDARATLQFTIGNNAAEYVTITKTGFTDNSPVVIDAQNSRSGQIVITLKKRSIEPVQISFTIELIVEPVSKEETEPAVVPPDEPEEPEPDENRVMSVIIDNRPTPSYVPAYDDTGANLREYVTMEVNLEYGNADVEVVQRLFDEEKWEEYFDSSRFHLVSSTNKKYIYQVDLRNLIEDYDRDYGYDFEYHIILTSKEDPEDTYEEYVGSFGFVNRTSGFETSQSNLDYEYERGVKPWATWFMNDGRENFCGWLSKCSSFDASINGVKFHDKNEYDYWWVDSTAQWEYAVDVPGYDDNTGTTKRDAVYLDLDLTYDYQSVELVEYDGNDVWETDPIPNSNKVELLWSSGNNYRFKINLPTNVNDDYVRYYFRIYVKNKEDSDIIYLKDKVITLTVRYNDSTNKKDASGNTYVYNEGKKPWATWFAS